MIATSRVVAPHTAGAVRAVVADLVDEGFLVAVRDFDDATVVRVHALPALAHLTDALEHLE